MHIRNWPILGLLLIHAAAPAQAADVLAAPSLDDARALRARAKSLKDEAGKNYETDKAACQAMVIALNCMTAAKQRRIEALRAADTLEREGRGIEREVRRLEAEAKAAKREAEAPAQAAGEREEVQRFHQKEAQKAAERERKSAEEAGKIEGRRAKLAAEQAARQERLEQRREEDAKRAEQAPERARKRAERERQHAERVQRIDERARQYAEKLKHRESAEKARQAVQPEGDAAK